MTGSPINPNSNDDASKTNDESKKDNDKPSTPSWAYVAIFVIISVGFWYVYRKLKAIKKDDKKEETK